MEKKILTITSLLVFFAVTPALATGHSSPVGGGLFILLGLGAAYAGKKIYDFKKREPEA
jgi:hypothetical protein